jgi:hypothetical protein
MFITSLRCNTFNELDTDFNNSNISSFSSSDSEVSIKDIIDEILLVCDLKL